MAEALSHKAMSAPIMDVFFKDGYYFAFVDLIKKAQVEGLKKENRKAEQIKGKIPLFVRDSRGLLIPCGRF